MKNLFHTAAEVNARYLFKIEGNESAEVSTTMDKLKGLESEIGEEGIYAAMEAHATNASSEELQGYLKSLREVFSEDDLDKVNQGVVMKVESDGKTVSFTKKEAAKMAAVEQVKSGIDYASLIPKQIGTISEDYPTVGHLLNEYFKIPIAQVWQITAKLEEQGVNIDRVNDKQTFQFVQDGGNYFVLIDGKSRTPLTGTQGVGPSMDAME